LVKRFPINFKETELQGNQLSHCIKKINFYLLKKKEE